VGPPGPTPGRHPAEGHSALSCPTGQDSGRPNCGWRDHVHRVLLLPDEERVQPRTVEPPGCAAAAALRPLSTHHPVRSGCPAPRHSVSETDRGCRGCFRGPRPGDPLEGVEGVRGSSDPRRASGGDVGEDGRGRDAGEHLAQPASAAAGSAVRRSPAARPRATTASASLRDASSIISSPSMTAPRAPPACEVWWAYASRTCSARSYSDWDGVKISLAGSIWSGWSTHLPSKPSAAVR